MIFHDCLQWIGENADFNLHSANKWVRKIILGQFHKPAVCGSVINPVAQNTILLSVKLAADS
jgi:hypothetical protein